MQGSGCYTGSPGAIWSFLKLLSSCEFIFTRLEAPVVVLKYYQSEVQTMMMSGDPMEFNQLRRLELSSLNLFIEQKSDLRSLDTGTAVDRFLR